MLVSVERMEPHNDGGMQLLLRAHSNYTRRSARLLVMSRSFLTDWVGFCKHYMIALSFLKDCL